MQFQQNWPKEKKLQLFYFLAKNFRSTELYGAPLEGSTLFLNGISTCHVSIESYRLAELKYAIFSRTGSKTKNYSVRSSFYGWSLSMGS